MATTFYEDTMERRRRMLPLSLGVSSPDGVLTQNVQPGSALPQSAQRYRDTALRLAQEAADAENAEPDLASAQEYMRKRNEGSEMATLNALAAQFAGERFQPMQAQFLKRAAAAQEPLRIGTGMLTPDGQYVRDTVADAQRRAASKARQAQAYEQMATGLETAEQRRQDAAERARQADEFKRMGLDLQQQGLQLRRDIAGNRPQDDSKKFRVEDNLRSEFLKRADKIREGTNHAQNVVTLLSDPTIKNDATKQVSLVFSFGKMLDPESVVRESEYALIANARGLMDSLTQMIPALQTGAKLTPSQLQSMQAIAQQMLGGATGRIDALGEFYDNLAKRRGVDPENVLPSYATRRPSGGGGDMAAAAAAELERRRKANKP